MWADHPEIASREDLLALVPEAERDLDRRSLNVVAQVLSEGRKIGELDEAIIWEEILPDGTTREAIKPECKYLS